MVDVILSGQYFQSGQEGGPVICYDFSEATPMADDMLEYEACDSLCILMPQHFELWVCTHRAASMYNVLETVGFWKVESVNIDFGK